VRWWLNTDEPCIFSVDNASVSGMNFSILTPDIWMVQWTEGKGEIERQTADGKNLNGLREPFIDVTPYAPLFQQFLTLMQAKALLLPQAKKVQIDLINLIFDSKRQAPFHYPVAAGDYYWDATDATLFSSTVPAIQNTIAKVNEIIARLNTQFPALDSADAAVIGQVNSADGSIVSQVNSSIVTAGNTTSSAVNSNVVSPGDLLISQVMVNIINQGNALRDQINTNITNYVNSIFSSVAAQCASTHVSVDPGFVDLAAPGITSLGTVPGVDISFLGITADFANIGAYFTNISAPHATAPSTPWTAMSNVTASNISWIPVGGSAPVNVTPAEQAAILNGIAARTNNLLIKKNTKTAQVNALTTVPAVIAYDVTTGW
jgi:hypothetical protein